MLDFSIGDRVVSRCKSLGVPPYSDSETGLFRAYLTPAHGKTVDQVGAWMREAGMQVHLDPVANLIGRYAGSDPDAPCLVIGSHLDSVRNAGVYDGPLGVLLGIECVAALHREGRRLPFAIEVVGFGDEEGSRFTSSMVSTRAFAGSAAVDDLAIKDTQGVSIGDALSKFQSLTNLPMADTPPLRASRAADDVLAYLEAHIEQGPTLEAENLSVGVVTAIAGQLRFSVSLKGAAAHAGTTAMSLRRDALVAAAQMIVEIERIAKDDNSDLVATVGKLQTFPGSVNVVPGEVHFSLDVRSGDMVKRNQTAETIQSVLKEIATRRSLELAIECVQDLPASPCDPHLVGMLEKAIDEIGERPRRLTSGAGHDAMVIADLCPVSMLFIRCEKGISHNPAENVDPSDVSKALAVMNNYIMILETSQ